VAQTATRGSSLTNLRLAEAFLERARVRLKTLDNLRDEADFADVIREARDITELCFRGMLRIFGIEVSRWLDVGDVLTDNIHRLPPDVVVHKDRILEIYHDLKQERQSALLEESATHVDKLMMADADRAIAEAEWILDLAQVTVDIVAHRRVPTTPVR